MKDDIKIPDLDFNDMEKIVDLGVRNKVSFLKYLKNVYKELGFKNIFHDKNELFIIIITFIILSLTLPSYFERSIEDTYKFVFLIAPILYLITSIFSFYNSKENGAFEIEMTCKYNLYQLSAIRMFIFSVVTAIINTIIIFIGSLFNKELDVIRLVCVSITGLFLFSTIFLYVLIAFRSRVIKSFIIAGWIVINIFLSNLNSSIYNTLLTRAPIYMHIIITAICIALYVRNLNKLINFRREKGEI